MDESNKSFFMPKISKFIQIIGVSLALSWTIVASFIYFEQLANFPSSYNEKMRLGLERYFSWDDDYDRRDDALKYAKKRGHEHEAQRLLDMGFRFLKPIFNATGYLALMILPILMGWLSLCLVLWNRRRLMIVIVGYLIFLSLSSLLSLTVLFSVLVGIAAAFYFIAKQIEKIE
ncbi:MAG: hypothetical protein M1114_02695 [Candidatus Dependentiae bacterium]|nr:hypothetical protein [Candidatus Dependentiae bacterium]